MVHTRNANIAMTAVVGKWWTMNSTLVTEAAQAGLSQGFTIGFQRIDLTW